MSGWSDMAWAGSKPLTGKMTASAFSHDATTIIGRRAHAVTWLDYSGDGKNLSRTIYVQTSADAHSCLFIYHAGHQQGFVETDDPYTNKPSFLPHGVRALLFTMAAENCDLLLFSMPFAGENRNLASPHQPTHDDFAHVRPASGSVRDDQILTNPFWRDSFRQRRCLVPASSFCEPNGDVKPATWHWFAIRGDDSRPLFAFPGIWRRYQGPVKKDGPNVDIETYAFLTTTPNSLVGTINHERMPVLLTRDDEFEAWLRGSQDEAMALAREYPADQMRIVQEGFDKEDLLKAA